jgi:hypothetical protein
MLDEIVICDEYLEYESNDRTDKIFVKIVELENRSRFLLFYNLYKIDKNLT